MSPPTVAVWKFASCDGCQLTIIDCEDELLAIAAALDIRMFLEAGPSELLDHYDISFVEGSVTTAHDAERLRDVRARSGLLVTIGACATSGGIQALRNTADVGAFTAAVYARPDWISTLATSTPIADHVKVDLELRGCPISKEVLLATITALLAGRRPPVTSHSVCVECKQAGNPCVLVAHGAPCLGPVTHGAFVGLLHQHHVAFQHRLLVASARRRRPMSMPSAWRGTHTGSAMTSCCATCDCSTPLRRCSTTGHNVSH